MLDKDNTTIIGIDLQEKLVNMLSDSEVIGKNCTALLKTADILKINTILTEQYPKGLGSTIQEIKNIKNFKTFEKTTFSACKTNEFTEELKKSKNKKILLFGIETHICVLQTATDLIRKGYNLFIVSDCSSSRDELNHRIAIEFLKQIGCKIITKEIALFMFLKSSKHENFKEIQALIK